MLRQGYIIVLLTAMLFQVVPACAQHTRADSLLQQLQQDPRSEVRITLLNDLSTEYLNREQFQEAVASADEAIGIAEKTGDQQGKAYALKNKGLAAYYQGNYLQVFENWSRSLELFEALKDTLGIANMASNLGVIYYDQGSHDNALTYYFKSLGMSEKLGDPKRITTALVNIGGVYTQMKEYDKALEYYQQIEKYLPTLHDGLIQSTYLMGVGEVYSLRGNHDEAAAYYAKALVLNKATPDYAHNLTMIGREEYKRGNAGKALEYLNLALEASEISNSSLDRLQTLTAMGDIYSDKDPRKALRTYREAEEIALGMETNEELRDVYKGMSLTYEALGNFKNAYAYQNKYLELKDLVFNIETDDKIRGLQFDFDLDRKQDEIGLLEKETQIAELEAKRQKYISYGTTIALGLVFLLALGTINRYRYVKKTNRIIEDEKNRSENLLLNILPEETAAELKRNGKVSAKKFDVVTVLFTDFKGFTYLSQHLSPEDLVRSVDHYFSRFDEIMEKYDLEKIKTVGDAYMCAGGLPFPSADHPIRMVKAAIEIVEVMTDSKNNPRDGIVPFDIRIGINTGTVVAGVVGIKKFAYDIWGDAVNVASRMETMSEPGRINISENTYDLVKDHFECEFRGEVFVKNKGKMNMYFVNGAKDKIQDPKVFRTKKAI